MGKREKNERLVADAVKIAWCLAAVIIVAASAIFAVSRISGGVKHSIEEYGASVSINGENVNAYKISGSGPYIVAEELPAVSLKADFTEDENITVCYTERENVEKTVLTGKTARLLSGDFFVNREEKGTALGSYSDNKNVVKQIYTADGLHLIPLYDLKSCGILEEAEGISAARIAMQTVSELLPKVEIAAADSDEPPLAKPDTENAAPPKDDGRITVFLDAGHGKSSSLMSDEEKSEYGWVQNENGDWGEWRHWRNGNYGADCIGSDGEAQEGECWYPIENGDRDAEPEINMQNCIAAKEQLEKMGYNVVLSRESGYENPSITKRINDAKLAGADLYVCVHSNAGGGSGSAYISLDETDGYYLRQNGSGDYAKNSNILGKLINDRIVFQTSLPYYGGGSIDSEPWLILFEKSPIVCAYLEIGFFDNESDLAVLNGEYDKIGLSIAEGVNDYCEEYFN